ncbi:hypothetical protein GCM10010106_18350 [Thermopolyspora flexuosa]|uniref:Lantibiotic biosynthesis dehydratase-like protein n=1 Tax=Thermopolyspora flexuosa TaxID=103836 RepID=A0A543J473_9ACTN|nr:thiopeptide maturation pyridine synthase [Thermopolyspora flexuosa]TQM77578.1 lantibiotic biosynthesis dehydratase-like protein [Thermopolyspora flexuosa]GGM72340.1 hypothetical protein GCM10010106_18350 [Thermopolyspora flexuosa]
MTTPHRPGPATAWHCVHVYYHADQDPLLLDAVRPLFDEIRDSVAAAYVLRHWRQGPHLRINVRAERSVWEDRVRPRVYEVIGAYLRDHPSTARLDPEQSLPRHRLLALREQEHGPLTPWPPDNSICDMPFDSRRHVLGSDAAVELLTSFYSDSTPLLFAMLDHVRAGRDTKPDLAMSLMLTVAHTSRPITQSFVSFRSHSEGYLTWAADPPAARAAFDRHYEERREAYTARVRDVIGTLDDPARPAAPFVREWAALLAEYRHRAGALIERGELVQPMPRPEPSPPRLGDIPVPSREPGELHRLIFNSPAYRRDVFEHPDFLRYRVLLNYTYLHLTRLGLTPLERFRLCHVIANAVEEVYGVSAIDLIRRSIAALEA